MEKFCPQRRSFILNGEVSSSMEMFFLNRDLFLQYRRFFLHEKKGSTKNKFVIIIHFDYKKVVRKNVLKIKMDYYKFVFSWPFFLMEEKSSILKKKISVEEKHLHWGRHFSIEDDTSSLRTKLLRWGKKFAFEGIVFDQRFNFKRCGATCIAEFVYGDSSVSQPQIFLPGSSHGLNTKGSKFKGVGVLNVTLRP